MFSQSYYVLRAKRDGQYLAARPRQDEAAKGFLMLFSADHEALTYVNQHAAPLADQFSVESVLGSQLKTLLSRWGYGGIGLVKDPLTPSVEFLTLR
ncbi:MAG: hypothetical protein AAFU71_02495 [Cyanobacteria bacterium J06632_22]